MVTVLYAGILGLMSVLISLAAAQARGRAKVSVGDGGNPELLLAMRRHANFVEYTPLALILIGLLEWNEAPAGAVHALGAGLVVFRASHALGIKVDSMQSVPRLVGAMGTMLVTVVASVWAVVLYF
ncbi:MAG: MAPEG family protein [Proteobacteria bacterium]|nr:MAPEG family protein [Pseudomonadota bacterium]